MKLEWKTCFKVGVSAFLLFLCIHYWEGLVHTLGLLLGAATPLLIGAGVAYVVNILMSRYETWYFPRARRPLAIKSRRPMCMLLAYLSVLAVVILVTWLVVPQLIACIQLIVAELPGAFTETIKFLDRHDLLSDDLVSTLSGIDWRSRIGEIVKVVTSGLGSVVDIVVNALSSVFSGLVTGVLSIIFSVYLLYSKETLLRQFRKVGGKLLRPRWHSELRHILFVLNETFRKFIVGQCTEALILGVLCTLGMWLFRMPYAAMIGALVAFTALIPIAGAYIGAIVGAFMIMTVAPIKALVFLIFLVILQQLEGNIVYPKVVGSSIGLPGIWVLAAVTVGGGIAGIPGMLFGVPLTAALYRLLRERINTERSPLE